MLSLNSENLNVFILYFVSQSGFVNNFSIYIHLYFFIHKYVPFHFCHYTRSVKSTNEKN